LALAEHLGAIMTKLATVASLAFAALVFAAFPAAAQLGTTNNQVRSPPQNGTTQAPITGMFCIEEMTANFCNVVTRPNSGGCGARSGSGLSGGPGGSTTSIPPCPSEPPFNELCN
jgi:hypothetical protein